MGDDFLTQTGEIKYTITKEILVFFVLLNRWQTTDDWRRTVRQRPCKTSSFL